MRNDPRIKAVACFGYCFDGRIGMDRCAKCDGTGSQLAVSGIQHRRFPNTKEGYEKALKLLDEAMG